MDAESFEAAYTEHRNHIFNYLYRQTGLPSVAEDLTSDTFERALKAWSRFDGARLKPWLFRIATNVLLDDVRRRKVIQFTEFDPSLHDQRGMDATERTVLDTDHAAVHTWLLGLLPAAERAALEAYERTGSPQAVADHFGCTMAAAKSRLHRARARYRHLAARFEDGRTVRPVGGVLIYAVPPSHRRKTTRRSVRGDRLWTAAEDDVLRSLWGILPVVEVSRRLGNRSVYACGRRASDLRLCARLAYYNANAVCRIFGTELQWLRRRIDGGAIVPASRPGRDARWRFTPAEVERFIREHPWEYHRSRMPAGYWRDLADRVATDDWLTLPEAAQRLGCGASMTRRLALTGRLPYRRSSGSALRSEIRIPASALGEWKAAA